MIHIYKLHFDIKPHLLTVNQAFFKQVIETVRINLHARSTHSTQHSTHAPECKIMYNKNN